MTDWLATLEVKDLWKEYDQERTTLPQVATEMAKRLAKLELPPDAYPEDRDRFVKAFQEHAEMTHSDKEEAEEEFDDIMQDVWDWADTERIWIATVI